MKFLHVACAALLALNAGCLKTVTIRTVIEDDGSAERYIKIESQGERAPSVDSDLRLPERKGWKLYKSYSSSFEARGKFKSVADIPADFRKGAHVANGERRFIEKSRSVKTYKAFRCALFAVHDYTETITDCTSVDEFNKAVEKVIELRTLAYAIIEKGYGEEFDLTEAKAYVDKEIVPRARRFAAAYWDARKDKRPGLEERFKECMRKPLRELGVELPAEGDIPDSEFEAALEKWVPMKVSQLVKRKKGKPLTPEEVEERLKAEEDDDKLTKIAKEMIKKKFGSQEAFEARMQDLAEKLLGAYLQILAHGFQFDATVVIPGQVVETNGFINKDEVRWSFDHHAIFPGYTMRVRSVAFTRANDLGDGRSVITSPKRAIILAEFTEKQNENDRFRILTAIGEVARTRSPAALRRLAKGDGAVTGLEGVLKKTGLSREE